MIILKINNQNVEATIIGDLGVYDDLVDSDRFCIIHVPSLTDFMKAVPYEEDKLYEEEDIQEWCRRVQQNLKADWAALRWLTPDSFDGMIEIKQRIRDWCLSVEL